MRRTTESPKRAKEKQGVRERGCGRERKRGPRKWHQKEA